MKKTFVLGNKTLVFTIIIFLIGTSIVSSANNIIKDSPIKYQSVESFNNQKNIIACDHTAYVGGSGEFCGLYEFTLNDPVNLTCIWPEGGGGFFIRGTTWTNDSRWLGCQYDTGALWEINLETGDMYMIGGGGTGCNDLAWDPVENRLYATSGYALYEYDPNTGEQDFIGNHGVSNMIALAIDSEGECYAWDVVMSGYSTLFWIDLETGQAYEVGSLGLSLLYAQDGDFCKEDDILYLAAYKTNPNSGSYLYECDEDTGSCTLVGQFQDDVEVALFMIPWNYPPNAPSNPNPFNDETGVNLDTDLSWTCSDPDGDTLTYDVYFGDNSEPPLVSSGQSVKIYDPGTLSLYTKYYWKIVAKDEHDVETESPIWSFTTRGNNPPDMPIITGPISGKIGTTYNYTFTSTDQDGDNIMYYYIIWGDSKFINKTGPFASGENVTASHKWKEEGTYVIKARATDVFGEIGYWGELTVTFPRSRTSAYLWYEWFLERFPMLERLLGFVIDI